MNDIKKEIDYLFSEITNSVLYKDYIRVTKELENNKEIMNIISEIKRLQMIATNNKDSVIENKIKELYLKLSSYPVYESYLLIKEELNDSLTMIKDIFENYFGNLLKLR